YLIKTEILIFNEIHSIELTLTERGSMKFPVLLGRKFLSKKFMVDTAKKNLSFKNIEIKI
ncbi:MAG: RimK/LysX family protein, partial [Lutibacter sp.]|nr:RimK/LysX family protein [Lutibacter sp.]